jgi:hypothetical protein
MEDSTVKRLALILAVQAEIDGMKAENTYRTQNELPPAYGSGHFQEKAEELRVIAFKHPDQL